METWDTFIPHRLGDTSGDYQKWRAEVLQIRDLPEYKLRKLWKQNFSPKDIAADKHWALYPPQELRKKIIAPGTPQEIKRGRTLTDKKKNWIYSRALLDAAKSVLAFYRLEVPLLAEVRKDVENFTALVRKYAHKKTKESDEST